MVGAADAPKEKTAGVRHVRMDLEKKETTRYIAAGGFDAVLFFFACQCEVIRLLDNELPDRKLSWEALKWVEVILLGLLAAWLTRAGENNAVLATVDYILRVKKNDMRFVEALRGDDAIHDLTLVQYSGDYID